MQDGTVETDQEVSKLDEKELRELLEQVIDHRKPESDKSSLVRRLHEEVSKDEASLEHGLSFSSRSGTASAPSYNISSRRDAPSKLQHSDPSSSAFGGRRSNSRGTESLSGRLGCDHRLPEVYSSQSLQDLELLNGGSSDAAHGSAAVRPGPTRTSRKTKATRANSLQQDHPELSNLSNERSASAAAGNSWSGGLNSQPGSSGGKMQLSTSKTSQSISSSLKSSPLPQFASHSSLPNDSNNNKSGSACDLDLGPSDSSSHRNFNSAVSRARDCDLSSVDKADSENVGAMEMKELRRQAQFVNYSSRGLSLDSHATSASTSEASGLLASQQRSSNYRSMTNDTPVDATVPFLESSIPYERLSEAFDSENQMLEDSSSYERRKQAVSLPNPATKNATDDNNDGPTRENAIKEQPLAITNKFESKKKSNKPKEQIVLAENIEGYVGYKDIEYLTDYVLSDNGGEKKGNSAKTGKSSATTTLMNGSASMGSLSNGNGSRPRKEKTSSESSATGAPTNAAPNSSAMNPASIKKPRNNSAAEVRDSLKGRQSADSIPYTTRNSSSSSSEPNATLASQELTRRTEPLRNLHRDAPAPITRGTDKDRAMSPASPTQASSVSSFVDGFSAQSDDEKGYHSDQDSGFQIQKTRRHKLRTRQQITRSLPLQRSRAAPAPVTSYANVASVPLAYSNPMETQPATTSSSVPQTDVQISAMEFPSLTSTQGAAFQDTPLSVTTGCNSYSAVLVPPSLPPVVMFDNSDVNEDKTIGTSFTFGFFDDEVSVASSSVPTAISTSTTASAPPVVVMSTQQTMEQKTAPTPRPSSLVNNVKTNSSLPRKPDVDVGTFNYFEIISYLRQAWEQAVAASNLGATTTNSSCMYS